MVEKATGNNLHSRIYIETRYELMRSEANRRIAGDCEVNIDRNATDFG
jgi:hypothetical protein